jgi:Asp-tRNA(Asn)/Glu-tRNA(Gln) amidotransferase A subunit family amidase
MKIPDKLKQLRSGKLDLCEYLRTVCDGIESKESRIQAFVPGTFDRDRILETANELVAKYPHPPDRPAVFGLPIGVKDIFRVHGFPTRCGSRLPASLFEGVETSCVSKLRQAGAIIMGKTVTAEFAGFEPGATRNPNNFAHTPGGSSSGSAAGVAADYFALALGTQTSGSITRPAAYCGVIGLKPSYGRIPRDGVILYSQSADHIGIFVKDADLISAIMPVLVKDWKFKKKASQKKLVVGLPDGPYLKQATQRALDHFFAQGSYVSDEELNDLRSQRMNLRKQIQKTMDDQQMDCWACPSATDLAPQGLSSTGDPIMNVPWSNSGLPTISVPSGFDPSGLPHEIQLVGKFMQDEDLVINAKKLEKDLI